jgi:SHS family lactate transporter-like MFS transporter
MSHGTQDIYPTFLQVQHKFVPSTVSTIAIIYNFGALLGGLFFGSLSQRIGRRRAIVIAASMAVPLIPLWSLSHTAAMLGLGAFVLQFMVQGAWGCIPAHLSELAPPLVRGTFIGLAYQCGNLIASINGPLQTTLAERYLHGNYGIALGSLTLVGVICVAVVTSLGKERHGASLDETPSPR